MKQHYTQGRELAAKGRHGDSMLLHVSPKEVHGLASLGALTGRRVTINPATGLPEAFDFSSLLPAVAGMIAGAVTMNPLVGAGVSAAASGGLTAAKGGSLGDVAQSALISGLTSYAGGQLAGGIGELGTLGGSGAAADALPTAAGVDEAAKAAAAAAKAPLPTPAIPPNVAAEYAAAGYTPLGQPQAPTFAENLSAFGTKAGNIGRAFTDNTGETFKYMAAHPVLTAGTALGLSGMGQYQAPADDTDDEKRTYPLRKGFGERSPPQTTSFPGPGYNPDAGDYNYFPGAGQPSAPPAAPTAGTYFASGGGSVPSGLRAMPDRRMASGGALDSGADIFRRPFGEAFNTPTEAYSPTYLTPPASEAPATPVGRDFVLPVPAGDGGGGGEGGADGGGGGGGNTDGDPGGPGGHGGGPDSDDGGGGADGGGADGGGGEAAGGLITLRKAAGGRAAGNSDHYGMTAGLMAEAQAALLGQHDDPRRALARFEAVFGPELMQILRDRVGGGRIRGAGGGLDDLIPGTIEGKQRVRLADGEFVVPADVVSGIGDGSTDQGVRKLHEMMTAVRAERTGKRTQPKRLREGALIV